MYLLNLYKNQNIIKFQKSLWINPLSTDEQTVWIERYGNNPIDDVDWDIVECENEDDDNDSKSTDYVKISLETLISTDKNTYVYDNNGYQITLTKKEIDTEDMWKYAI